MNSRGRVLSEGHICQNKTNILSGNHTVTIEIETIKIENFLGTTYSLKMKKARYLKSPRKIMRIPSMKQSTEMASKELF
jgi:hypothetical protein